eukprot:jgi/Botrbrau1/103/Bobra.0022s0092.1
MKLVLNTSLAELVSTNDPLCAANRRRIALERWDTYNFGRLRQFGEKGLSSSRRQTSLYLRSSTELSAIWSSYGEHTGLDPDEYEEPYYDSDDFEDEFEVPRQQFPSRVKGLGDMLEVVPRDALAAVQATSVETAAVFSKAATKSFHKVREAAAEAARAAQKSAAAEKLKQAQERLGQATAELPEGVWAKIAWVWDFPPVKSLRITITAAQWGMHLPTLLALIAAQWSVIFAHVSPTMLAPLLFGAPMLLRSVYTNASIIFPRIGVTAMVLWVLWSANGILQSAVYNLRLQGKIDYRLSSTIITCTEILSMITALIILLSMFGINVSALILPAGVAVAFASKDLVLNFLAGFFLLAVQPFKVGDSIGLNVSVGGADASFGNTYFEGNCCKVDLRFTHIRRGRERLVVPNATFLTKPFVVVEEGGGSPGVFDRTASAAQAGAPHQAGAQCEDPSPNEAGHISFPREAGRWARGLVTDTNSFSYPPGRPPAMWPSHAASHGVLPYNGSVPPLGHDAPGAEFEQHFLDPRPWGNGSPIHEDAGFSVPAPRGASGPSHMAHAGPQGPQPSRGFLSPSHMASTRPDFSPPYSYPLGPSHMAPHMGHMGAHSNQPYPTSSGLPHTDMHRARAKTQNGQPYANRPGPGHSTHSAHYNAQPYPSPPGPSQEAPPGSLERQPPPADQALSEKRTGVSGYQERLANVGTQTEPELSRGSEGRHGTLNGTLGPASASGGEVQLPTDVQVPIEVQSASEVQLHADGSESSQGEGGEAELQAQALHVSNGTVVPTEQPGYGSPGRTPHGAPGGDPG